MEKEKKKKPRKKNTVTIEVPDDVGGYKGEKVVIDFDKAENFINDFEVLNIGDNEIVVNKFITETMCREILTNAIDVGYSHVKAKNLELFGETAYFLFKRTFEMMVIQLMTNIEFNTNKFNYDKLVSSVIFSEVKKHIINYDECLNIYLNFLNNFVVTETIAMLLDSSFNADLLGEELEEAFMGLSEQDAEKVKMLVNQANWEEYKKREAEREEKENPAKKDKSKMS